MDEAQTRLLAYIVALLEEIAYNTRPYQNQDHEVYLQRLKDASGIESTVQLFSGLRARPPAHEREVPQHEPVQDERVRVNPASEPAKKGFKKLFA